MLETGQNATQSQETANRHDHLHGSNAFRQDPDAFAAVQQATAKGTGTFGGGLLGPGGAGIQIIPQPFPAMQLVMPVGGFLVLGFVLAGCTKLMKYLGKRSKKKKKKEAAK